MLLITLSRPNMHPSCPRVELARSQTCRGLFAMREFHHCLPQVRWIRCLTEEMHLHLSFIYISGPTRQIGEVQLTARVDPLNHTGTRTSLTRVSHSPSSASMTALSLENICPIMISRRYFPSGPRPGKEAIPSICSLLLASAAIDDVPSRSKASCLPELPGGRIHQSERLSSGPLRRPPAG